MCGSCVSLISYKRNIIILTLVYYKYSICTTSYKSATLVADFLRPFLDLGQRTQIVVVDNDSKDGTTEKLAKFGDRIKVLSLKCSRGLGRQRAMEISDGEIIVNVEFDVEYSGIRNALDYYEKSDKGKIYYFMINGQKCNASLYIGRRELFFKTGGFPDLNYAEDLYLNKIAQKLGLFEPVNIDMDIHCLEVSGISSGSEARYANTKFKLAMRRLIATRDILFVNQISYADLMKKYKLKGAKAIFIGLPEYLIGKILRFTIKVPKIDA